MSGYRLKVAGYRLGSFLVKKSFFIFITVFMHYGCISNKKCKGCDTQNWFSSARMSSDYLIGQITEVLLQQDNNDSLSYSFQNVRQNKFLYAKDSLRMNYQGKSLKWFRENPLSWISIDTNSVTVCIKYCEKWCDGIPYVYQLYLIQTKSNPELKIEGVVEDIEKLICVKDDWYLAKTECKGCGI
jgi:hypothetical protein